MLPFATGAKACWPRVLGLPRVPLALAALHQSCLTTAPDEPPFGLPPSCGVKAKMPFAASWCSLWTDVPSLPTLSGSKLTTPYGFAAGGQDRFDAAACLAAAPCR
jgi:hypothetical protein